MKREVRLYDKLKALELCGKYLGIFEDKVDMNIDMLTIISGTDELED